MGHSEQPRIFGDRYELIEIVGEGATAVTWRSFDRRLGRQVAVKVLKRDGQQNAEWVRRFEREVSTSASISHAKVVHVYDVGQQDGWLYLVMQFVDGEDLKIMIRRRGRIPVAEAVGYARQILEGLAAIHRAGVLHRDIKPQNVLIDREGVARVTDFGIAWTTDGSSLTTEGMALGTAAYMAPEQAQAGKLSEATDNYAVGVVLYELLTGTVPYVRDNAVSTMLAHIQETPVPPSVRAPEAGIPARLDGVVLQAMSREPAARFRNAAAMLGALEEPNAAPGQERRLGPSRERTRETEVAIRSEQTPGKMTPPIQPHPPAQQAPSSGGVGRHLLTLLLVLILLSMALIVAYMMFERFYSGSSDRDRVIATVTQESEHHSEPNQQPAIDPPTLEPSITPVPLEVTAESTVVVIQPIGPEDSDSPEQIIEPQS